MSRLDAIKDWEDRVRTAGYHAPDLARQVGISEHQLRRHFTRLFGLPSQHWIDQLRVRDACRLLMDGEPVKSVAFQLGFKQVSHFCTFFKGAMGISPSAFRSR
jgi:AraC family transcriptional regulator